MVNNEKNEPVFTFNAGQVRGAIFKNSNKDNEWFSTKINKSYNEGSVKKPDYKETNNYNDRDLADLQLVTTECYKYVRTHFASEE